MVTYEEFKEQMREKAESEIGGRAIVKPVKKLNGVVLDGLSIMTLDSNISPTIYLNDYYLQYKNHLVFPSGVYFEIVFFGLILGLLSTNKLIIVDKWTKLHIINHKW